MKNKKKTFKKLVDFNFFLHGTFLFLQSLLLSASRLSSAWAWGLSIQIILQPDGDGQGIQGSGNHPWLLQTLGVGAPSRPLPHLTISKKPSCPCKGRRGLESHFILFYFFKPTARVLSLLEHSLQLGSSLATPMQEIKGENSPNDFISLFFSENYFYKLLSLL